MGKTVRFKNIQGGVPPYKKVLLPIGEQESDSFNNVPNGTFRAKVVDGNNTTTAPKIIEVNDPSHNTNRNINWDSIPNFQLPPGLMAIGGDGFPRWLNESEPSDATNRGWTHMENVLVDGTEMPNSKRGKTLYFPFNTAWGTAVEQVIPYMPNAKYVRVIEMYKAINITNSPKEVTYKNAENLTETATVPASMNGVEEEISIWVLLNEQPYGTGVDFVRTFQQKFVNPSLASDEDILECGKVFYSHEKWSPDGPNNNPTACRVNFFDFDEEVLSNSERANALIIKGMKQQADADGNPLFILYYGKWTSDWGLGYYSGAQTGSWKQKKFPHLPQANRDAGIVPNNWINQQALVDANCVYIEGGYYFKTPYGTQRKYEKQGNNFVIDVDGERKWRTDKYQEIVRGQDLPIRTWSDTILWIDADPSYGYPDNRVGEVWWMVHQFYAMATRMIFSCLTVAKKCRNNLDIYSEFNNIPFKIFGSYRDETEQGFPGYADHPRPISTFQVEFQMFLCFAMCETFYIWTEYGNTPHPATAPTHPYRAINKGQGYKCQRTPNNTETLQFSQFEDMTWGLKYLKQIHDEHNIFGAGNKKVVGYQPADASHEILIFGRINANKLWIIAAEPRLDPGESIILTVKNKKNSFSRSVRVEHARLFTDVFVFPAGTSYEPGDVVFEYTDLYGSKHTLSGDLRSHTVNPTTVPPDTGGGSGGGGQNPTSIFQFTPKMNGNPYPGASPLDQPTGNGYVTFKFAGWSIVSSDASLTPKTVQSHVKIQLFDFEDNLVCNIEDRRGNYHPNFVPFFPVGTDLRSNNHLSEFAKYLPTGAYRLEITNISPTNIKQRIRLGTEGTGGNPLSMLDEDLAQGDTKIITFNLNTPSDPSNKYVMNCNMYQYP